MVIEMGQILIPEWRKACFEEPFDLGHYMLPRAIPYNLDHLIAR